MKQIVIYGAGGFGKEVYCSLKRINDILPEWDIVGFIDDGLKSGTIVNNLPVLGDLNFLNSCTSKLAVVIAIGNLSHFKRIVSYLTNTNLFFPNIVDPTAVIDANIKWGIGNFIHAFSFISVDVTIGNFNILNTRVTIGHDSVIGSFNIFNPNVQISGGVKIGDGNFWGLNSSIIQYKSIGNNNTIGACSLLLKNVKDNSMYFGIPAVKQQKF